MELNIILGAIIALLIIISVIVYLKLLSYKTNLLTLQAQNENLLLQIHSNNERQNEQINTLLKEQEKGFREIIAIKENSITSLNDEVANLKEQISNFATSEIDLKTKIKELEVNLTNQISENKKLNQNQLEIDKELREYFNLKTKEMSENLLNLNSEKLGESSQKILENLINPLKAEIKKYQEEHKETSTIFQANFNNLKNETKNIMNEAKNLADALKGNKKILGNWGEMQLDAVLENSGLKLGENYQKQVSYTDSSGNRKILDAVVNFGEGKEVIIDAKCSLVNYSAYFNETDESQKQTHAINLAKDIKNHIDTLSSKDYKNHLNKTYEYVFMFIPNDGIFYTALNSDSSLYDYAFEKGVFITTPLTLLMALKTVYICWKHIKADENVDKIFGEFGKFGDKFQVFISNYEKINSQLLTVLKTYESTQKTLNGRDGLIDKMQNLKNFGAKITKPISSNI